MGDIPERESAVHMFTARRMPVTLVRGEGTRVWDDEGRSYLDFIAGISTVTLGHGHPGLADAVTRQARTLMHVSNLVYSVPQIELAELLTQHSALDKVFFANSGAEANEGAIKLARKWGLQHREGYEIIVADNSFHGRTLATVAATGTARYREPFGPPVGGFVFVGYDNVEDIMAVTTPRTAAVMLEPVQGEGGVNVPSPDYLRRVREWCDEQGMLLVLDEVQSGCGRTGSLWAYEQAGIEPDIMTLAKGLGGGFPVGAVLAKDHCAVFEPGDHGSTFGGNPLATSAALYVMRQLIEGDVLENVRVRSAQLEQRLRGLVRRETEGEGGSPLATGERGAGLLRALELSRDIAADVVMRAIDRGLLVNPVRPNAVRFMPPLTVTPDEIDEAVDIVEAVLDEFRN